MLNPASQILLHGKSKNPTFYTKQIHHTESEKAQKKLVTKDMRIHHIEPSNNTNYSVGSEERVPPLSDITNDVQMYNSLPDLNETPIMQGQLPNNIGYEDDEEYPNVDVECDEIYTEDYWDIGDATYECEKYGALFWYEERIRKHYNSKKPIFTMCCDRGKIKLPDLKKPPEVLKQLLFGSGPKSSHFRENIRSYDSIFSFTRGEDINKLHAEIVSDLKQMLDDNNVLAKTFRMVRDRFQENIDSNVKLRLIGKRSTDGRRYNLPTIPEVAALVVGDFEVSGSDRDIIIETQSGQLQRINELNAAYLGLQYPLLFPYGEDGYREDIPLSHGDESSRGRQCVSMREFFAYRIQERKDEVPTIVSSGRLFQQFLVDGYTMIESSRLKFIRTHQKQLRVDSYKVLAYAILHGDIDPSSQGKRIILPSSFTGGARYMVQNYQDAMAICKWAGYPDLFITFTCNPKWPEITRFVESRNLNPEDRPDILSRVFKIKLDHLIMDLRDNQVFGQVKAGTQHLQFILNKDDNLYESDNCFF
ncbi:uncharacterized protein [Nicotiana sylvestris]|uniref:uncharacterized protein n=1 Tax=Nicotiana sylvestris TaxID=4096 RepID=UPI00388C73A6